MAILQNFDENRKTKRFDVAVPAQVTSFKFSELVRVHDLSRGGCRISSEGSLSLDKIVHLELYIPKLIHNNRKSKGLMKCGMISGKIAYCSQWQLGGIKQYGIQFLSSPIESHGIPKIIREIQRNTERYRPAMRWVA
jgi:hypothetical protein